MEELKDAGNQEIGYDVCNVLSVVHNWHDGTQILCLPCGLFPGFQDGLFKWKGKGYRKNRFWIETQKYVKHINLHTFKVDYPTNSIIVMES